MVCKIYRCHSRSGHYLRSNTFCARFPLSTITGLRVMNRNVKLTTLQKCLIELKLKKQCVIYNEMDMRE
jgi:hypothetical protein